MNIICKLFGHKNSIKKEIKDVKGYKVYYGKNSPWYCLRCGECTQRLYFSSLQKEK
jgi:heterodisulfide reductase subunit C